MHQEGRVGQMGKECSREPKVIVTLEEGACLFLEHIELCPVSIKSSLL